MVFAQLESFFTNIYRVNIPSLLQDLNLSDFSMVFCSVKYITDHNIRRSLHNHFKR